MIEFIRWQVRFFLLNARQWARARAHMLDQRTYNAFVGRAMVNRWLDRVSPFEWGGYRRVILRRIAFPLSVPTLFVRRQFYRLLKRVFTRLAPYTGPGKFEAWDPCTMLKAEWLYDHSEYAADTTGNSVDWHRWSAIFPSITVPWSRQPEHWIIGEDSSGFVSATQYDLEDDANSDFLAETIDYERSMQPEDEDDAWRMPSEAEMQERPETFGRDLLDAMGANTITREEERD